MTEVLLTIAFCLVWVVLGFGALWATLVLFHLPRIAKTGRIAASALFPLALGAVVIWMGGDWTAAGVVGCALLAIGFAWTFYRAEHRLAYAKNEPPMPCVNIDGDQITIRNYGDLKLENGEAKFDYIEKSFDLSKLESVWFGVQPFKGVYILGHTYAAFDFGDDGVLGVSVQSRRPEGTPFQALSGMFKSYGLIYFLCDERHAVGYESLCSGARLYLYRMRTDRDAARRLLLGALERADRLAEHPEFYHSLVNNCTSNLVCEANRILEDKLSIYSPRILLTGLSDRVAYDHGLIDCGKLSFEEIRERADVTKIACRSRDSADFSRQIRRAWEATSDAECSPEIAATDA